MFAPVFPLLSPDQFPSFCVLLQALGTKLNLSIPCMFSFKISPSLAPYQNNSLHYIPLKVDNHPKTSLEKSLFHK